MKKNESRVELDKFKSHSTHTELAGFTKCNIKDEPQICTLGNQDNEDASNQKEGRDF